MELTVLSATIILEFVFFELIASKDDSFMQRDPYFPPVWKTLYSRLRVVNSVLFCLALIVILLKTAGVLSWW